MIKRVEAGKRILTDAELKMLEQLENKPIMYDDDSPRISEMQLSNAISANEFWGNHIYRKENDVLIA